MILLSSCGQRLPEPLPPPFQAMENAPSRGLPVLQTNVNTGTASLFNGNGTSKDASDRYKTKLPFATPTEPASGTPLNQQPGEAQEASPVNPLLDEQPQVQMRQENLPKPADPDNDGDSTSRSENRPPRLGFAQTDQWEAPANEQAGNPSNVPGTTHTSPGSANRSFGTFGRALPVLPPQDG